MLIEHNQLFLVGLMALVAVGGLLTYQNIEARNRLDILRITAYDPYAVRLEEHYAGDWRISPYRDTFRSLSEKTPAGAEDTQQQRLLPALLAADAGYGRDWRQLNIPAGSAPRNAVDSDRLGAPHRHEPRRLPNAIILPRPRRPSLTGSDRSTGSLSRYHNIRVWSADGGHSPSSSSASAYES